MPRGLKEFQRLYFFLEERLEAGVARAGALKLVSDEHSGPL